MNGRRDYSNKKNLKYYKEKLKPKGYTLHDCIVCGSKFASKVRRNSVVKKLFCSKRCKETVATDPIVRETLKEAQRGNKNGD